MSFEDGNVGRVVCFVSVLFADPFYVRVCVLSCVGQRKWSLDSENRRGQ